MTDYDFLEDEAAEPADLAVKAVRDIQFSGPEEGAQSLRALVDDQVARREHGMRVQRDVHRAKETLADFLSRHRDRPNGGCRHRGENLYAANRRSAEGRSRLRESRGPARPKTLASLTVEKRELEAELAQQPEAEIVALHPATITRYIEAIDDLASALRHYIVAGGDDVAAPLHELVEAVIVHPCKEGEPDLGIKGRLAALTGDDLFPERTLSGGLAVAEEGLEPPTHGL